MAPEPKDLSKNGGTLKASKCSSSASSSSPSNCGGKISRDQFAKKIVVMSPTTKARAMSVLICRKLTMQGQAAAYFIEGANYGAGSFLRDCTNFNGIKGRLLFSRTVENAILPQKLAEVGFLNPPKQKPFHAFFYRTAVAQGLEDFFDNIPDAIALFCNGSVDTTNGDRPWKLEVVTEELAEDDMDALIRMSELVSIV